jgi:hypothetical protein
MSYLTQISSPKRRSKARRVPLNGFTNAGELLMDVAFVGFAGTIIAVGGVLSVLVDWLEPNRNLALALRVLLFLSGVVAIMTKLPA